jgi:hypothetical protein
MPTQDEVYVCMACDFTTMHQPMLIAHQAQCANIDQEKREYRLGLLLLFFPEDVIPEVLELAREQAIEQGVHVC